MLFIQNGKPEEVSRTLIQNLLNKVMHLKLPVTRIVTVHYLRQITSYISKTIVTFSTSINILSTLTSSLGT